MISRNSGFCGEERGEYLKGNKRPLAGLQQQGGLLIASKRALKGARKLLHPSVTAYVGGGGGGGKWGGVLT